MTQQLTTQLANIKASSNFKNSINALFNDLNQKSKFLILENIKVYNILRTKKTENEILNYIKSKIK